jgi:alcohol dehydrogenase (cytochrome c)
MIGRNILTLRHIMAAAALLAGSPALAEDGPGRSAYLKHCAGCHGIKLVGQFAKPLTGDAFHKQWDGKAKELRAEIARTMPPSGAGELPAKVYDDVTAYLLGETPSAAPPLKTSVSKTSATEVPGPMPAVIESVDNRDAPYHAIMARRAARLSALTSVTDAMLRNPPTGDWLAYRRTDDAHGFSPLTQIDRSNAARLTLAWAQSLSTGTNGITPLVHDGVIFVNSNGTVTATDAATGDTLWSFARPVEIVAIGPPVSQPAGMAIAGERLFVPTNDRHVIALDIRTGKIVWDHTIAGFRETLKASAAPLIVRDKLIQGMSGCAGVGEPGGCFIVALDLATGKEVWRFNTVARPGTKHGDTWNGAPLNKRFGGSVWATGSYDPGTGLVYFGAGQTYHVAPLMEPKPKSRAAAAALYTDSTLALDPDTGKLVWHYQHLARDVWDLDFAFERTLATMKIGGKTRRVVMTMGKMALMDILDAKTGQYLGSRDLGQQNIITTIDPKTGWKTTDPALEPIPGKPILLCPHAVGARNRGATAFDTSSGLLYVPLFKGCMIHLYSPGSDFDVNWGMQLPRNPDGNFGEVVALDVAGNKTRWVKGHRASESSAILTTAGGVLFEGGRDYAFRASDSATGAILWETRLSGSPSAAPISFTADGVQYVAITTGGGNPHDATVSALTPEIEPGKSGTMLWVFRVGGN